MGRSLQTPRAAGLAGIVFAVLLAAVIVLIRLAVPEHSVSATWLTTSTSREAARAALALVPFAGIVFLWFMGAVRSYVGKAEDKFFATVFLGSGLIFTALLFALSAGVGSLLASDNPPRGSGQSYAWQYGRDFAFTLLTSYCMRMAAVFVICTTAIGSRLGIFPRWLTWLGYLVAVILLFVVSGLAWFELAFPVWTFAVSVHILVSTRSSRKAVRPGAS